jgi:hypothetical protein
VGALILLAVPVMYVRFASTGRASDLDRAYAAASAMISVLALCGVIISLTLQWRQVQVSQAVAAKERHFELVMLAFEDPRLVFEQSPLLQTDHDRRVWMHSNLWMTQWNLLWQLRQIDESKLRRLALTLFQDPSRLTWWQAAGSTWSGDHSRRSRAFFQIVQKAHQDAQAAPTNLGLTKQDPPPRVPHQRA